MRRIIVYLLELGIVIGAVVLGRSLSEHYDIIPRAVFAFPGVTITSSDFSTILLFFGAVHAVIFLMSGLAAGDGVFRDAKRTAVEIYALISGLAISAVLLFVVTEVSFNPQLMAWSGVLAFTAFVALDVGASRFQKYPGPGKRLAVLAGDFFRLAIRPIGILAFLLVLSPLVIAKVYLVDRDFANLVTRARLFFNAPPTTGFVLVNAFPDISFRQPMDLQFSPSDDEELYVLERHGRLLRISADRARKEIVLDFAERVGVVDVENGALSFDHHPEFGRFGSVRAGYVYIYFTSVFDGRQINYLSRFDLSLLSAEARLASELRLIARERRPDGYHNGGSVEFGPDGFLYFSVGEASDKASHQRIDRSLSGGIFRIDVDQKGGGISHALPRQPDQTTVGGYFIPNDNPFVGVPGALEEFWALGLRNPFRFSFDRRNGDIWVGDVGSTRIEEVNIVRPGHNYQFPYLEGVSDAAGERPQDAPGVEAGPVHFYEHTAFDRAVIGGPVYQGLGFPEFEGKYIFADNYSGKVWMIDASGEFQAESELIAVANKVAQQGISSLKQAPSGQILVTTLGRSQVATGQVLTLVYGDTQSGTKIATASEPPISAAETRESFNSYCGRCHGASGRGDGPDAAELGVSLPDFTTHDFWHMKDDEDLAAVIWSGGEAAGLSPMMPPWEGILSEAEVAALVSYMRWLED